MALPVLHFGFDSIEARSWLVNYLMHNKMRSTMGASEAKITEKVFGAVRLELQGGYDHCGTCTFGENLIGFGSQGVLYLKMEESTT